MDVSGQRLLQNLFRSHHNSLTKSRLPLHQCKAIESIIACRSGALGTSYYECESGHGLHKQHHSCRHRSCYLCAQRSKHVWIEKQKRRLLDCPHFHMVFTVPSEYRVLWQYNQAWFAQALFTSAQQTVLTLMQDKQYHGVTPGLLLALHTWGRQLNLHPHIHALVTAGGLDSANQWHDTGDYLLPIRVLKSLYRGKLQGLLKTAFEAGEIHLPPSISDAEFYRLHRTVYRKEWSVRVEEQYRHGKGVVLYLSRYMKGGPINPKQIIRCDARGVSFTYTDHRNYRRKILTFKPLAFMRRLLLHVPAPGTHTVRHYGLYGGAAREKRNICRQLWGDLGGIESAPASQDKSMVEFQCRTCHRVMVRRFRWYPAGSSKGNSIIRKTVPEVVQQGVEEDHAKALRKQDFCYAFG